MNSTGLHMYLLFLEKVYSFLILLLVLYSATEQESRFLPLRGFCSVLWLNLNVSLFDLIPSKVNGWTIYICSGKLISPSIWLQHARMAKNSYVRHSFKGLDS